MVRAGRGAWVLGVVVLVALAAASVVPLDLGTDLAARGQGPSALHPLGTDHLGRDVAALTLRGIRNSAMVGVTAALISTVVGLAAGVAMGLGGARVDAAGMRLVEVTDAVPTLLLAVLVTALLGPTAGAIIVAIAITHWTRLARIVRAELSSLRSRDWLAASITMGGSRWHVAHEHVLPAVAGQAAVATVLAIPGAIGHEATLSFLGLGFPPDDPSLGTLIADAPAALVRGQVWPVLAPTAALVLLCLVGIVHLVGRRRPVTLERAEVSSSRVRVGIGASMVVEGLRVRRGDAPVLDGVDLTLAPGEFVALLGESGAGKSSLAQALVGVLPGPAEVRGSISVRDGDRWVEALGLSRERRRRLARRVSMVPQSAQTALPPTRRVRRSLAEAAGSRAAADGLLDRVGLDPSLGDRYPHELSGGQARRALLALALAGGPAVLVVDEPTVGLDAESSRRILRMLRDECARGTSVLVTTHEAELVLPLADRVLMLADGRLGAVSSAAQLPHRRHGREMADAGTA